MLPGFNHNIRFEDRLFHIQTEDIGLERQRLVTQLFIEGQVLALVKSGYADIVSTTPDPKTRDEQIRIKMQEQHKRILKNLVRGDYEDQIAAYLDQRTERPPESLPMSGDQAPIEISPESLTAPDFLAKISAAIHQRTPLPRHLASDLRPLGPAAPPGGDFLLALDAEMRTQGTLETTPVPEARPSMETMMEFGVPDAVRAVAKRRTPPSAAVEHSLDDVILSYLSDDVD